MIELCDHDACTGCQACANICGHSAISMVPDAEGFLNPRIDHDACVECGLCVKVCPILYPYDMSAHNLDSYAAFAKDHEVRTHGSSGGIFTLLARKVINEGGVVCGAAFDQDLNVGHKIIESIDQLPLLQGSKYVQSNIGIVFKEIKRHLISGRKVLFVGVSCQVAGLRKFLMKDYPNLITADLVCHGVPSHKIFDKYLDYLRSEYPGLLSYNFRDLKKWNCSSSSSSVRKPDGKIKTVNFYGIASGYFSFFINGYMSRECCYNCPYARTNPRIGDITLADFWGVGKAMPYVHSTKAGVSFVSPNTSKGIVMFNSIKDEMVYEPRNVEETIKYGDNSQLLRPAKRPSARNDFYATASRLDWPDLVKHYDMPLRPKRNILQKMIYRLGIMSGLIKPKGFHKDTD